MNYVVDKVKGGSKKEDVSILTHPLSFISILLVRVRTEGVNTP